MQTLRVLLALSAVSAALHLGSGPPLARSEEGAAVVRVGAGSYATRPPPGAATPPADIWQTESVRGKMPTNDWWSSLAGEKYAHPHYPHPLAVDAGPGGLRVFYPGPGIVGTKDAVFGFMPGGTGADLVLGHSANQGEFPDARVDGWSDWFVRVRFGAGPRRMTVSYGHGSPFVYALFEGGGGAKLTFAESPTVWSGDANGGVLGVTVGGKHYGLFGPTGSTWDGVGGKVLTNRPGGKGYFSLAVLPEATAPVLAAFRRYAYAHATDTRVRWAYDPATAAVTTRFDFTTTPHEPYEAGVSGTLFALYPHQWRHASASPPATPPAELQGAKAGGYPSVRGRMKLAAGSSFATEVKFPGVLPALPRVEGGADAGRVAALVRRELATADDPAVKDTYWEGKRLGRLTALVPVAEQYGLANEAAGLVERLRTRLEDWLAAAGPDGRPGGRLFYYDERWGTLIGYPASYGTDDQLNDHHFHYGYFIRAAAEVARHDPQWAAERRWGWLVNLLVRDVASPYREDPMFPFLRNFDPYAGHSWASGHARFGDGNNNESSSEAMNAWYGLVLWGEATGDRALRDLGVWLYTTEMTAIHEYWFDVHGENFPAGYTPSVVTMVWGGKGANGTWFSADPEVVHGINFLPVTGGSLYLGHHPAYVRRNFDALLAERQGGPLRHWADVLWMYRALSDPDDAARRFEAAGDTLRAEAGNSVANTYHWIYTLKAVGQVDPSVTADRPLAVAFVKDGTRTYATFHAGDGPAVIRFSDGFELRAAGKGFAVGKRPVTAKS